MYSQGKERDGEICRPGFSTTTKKIIKIIMGPKKMLIHPWLSAQGWQRNAEREREREKENLRERKKEEEGNVHPLFTITSREKLRIAER